ncbi:hypothetical protein Ae717Ps2_6124 [Pseudonocardia sp. Ae717_Ps2]|nr:hypothetical protein Ae717Ps2_6124 [Pseudonocardia sp. Ae717_Ps2]
MCPDLSWFATVRRRPAASCGVGGGLGDGVGRAVAGGVGGPALVGGRGWRALPSAPGGCDRCRPEHLQCDLSHCAGEGCCRGGAVPGCQGCQGWRVRTVVVVSPAGPRRTRVLLVMSAWLVWVSQSAMGTFSQFMRVVGLAVAVNVSSV